MSKEEKLTLAIIAIDLLLVVSLVFLMRLRLNRYGERLEEAHERIDNMLLWIKMGEMS